jgi:hypothetical protein
MVSDGAGGAIVAWRDLRTTPSDIYAQRVSPSGTVQWTPDGVPLCAAAGSQYEPRIASDLKGGAIVAWADNRSGNSDIYVQRIASDGSISWAADGVALCTAANDQSFLSIASDGAGGAIVAWVDFRRTIYGDIYAQRVGANGTVRWSTNGVALCTTGGENVYPEVTSDGSGGAIVTWMDGRMGADPYGLVPYDIYAQRVLASGAVQWQANGVVACDAASQQQGPKIVSDGMGGAIIAWWDARSASEALYAQRMAPDGTALWPANGVDLAAAYYNGADPEIDSDGAGGAVVAWADYRGNAWNVYAQRISPTGTLLWGVNGVAVCLAAGDQGEPAIATSITEEAIVSWQDARSGTGAYDIYAQRVLADGSLGGGTVGVLASPPIALGLDPISPNPSVRRAVRVRFSLASSSAAVLEMYDVAGRRVAAREVGSLGPGHHVLDIGEGAHLPPGIYMLRLRQGASVRTTRAVVLD